MTEFNLNDYLKGVDIIAEEIKEVDGSIFTHRKKYLKLGDDLTLILYESGQATLEYNGNEVETFYYDDESERLFSDIDNVKLGDLFAMMHDKRWISSVERSNKATT